MTNEQLIRQYYDGDEAALEKLYHKNIGLIRGIAKEAAAEFNCLMTDQHHPNQFSAYTKTILDDLCGEGALEILLLTSGLLFIAESGKPMYSSNMWENVKNWKMANWKPGLPKPDISM